MGQNIEQRIKTIELHDQGFSLEQIAERGGVRRPWHYKNVGAMYKNGQKDLLQPCTAKLILYTKGVKMRQDIIVFST